MDEGTLNENLYVGSDGHAVLRGNMTATGFITASNVAKDDGTSAFEQVENFKNWTKEDDSIDYEEHYAHTTYDKPVIDHYENKTEVQEVCRIEKAVLGLGKDKEICKEEEITTQIPIYKMEKTDGLDMEKRVAEMEKMIYELKLENEALAIRVSNLEPTGGKT